MTALPKSLRTALMAMPLVVPLTGGVDVAFAADHAASIAATPINGPALTLYQNGQTLVTDPRQATLPKDAASRGVVTLDFRGVAAGLMPSSAQVILGPDAKGAQVVQQRYQPAADEMQMLRALVGQTVSVVTTDSDGNPLRRVMTVLRADPSPILQDDKGLTFSIPGRLEFATLPPSLSLDPHLNAILALPDGALGGTEVQATLRYLTSGMDWNADHVITLAPDGLSLTLTSWATLTNGSGTTWTDAHVSLVAGSVNAGPMNDQVMMAKGGVMAMRAEAAPMAPPQAQAMGGYYLYALPQTVTLQDGETRQVALGTPQALSSKMRYELRPSVSLQRAWSGENTQSASMILDFATPKDGQPLPQGTVRVYGGGDGVAAGRFLGASAVSSTPAGESVHIPLGEAFDVTATSHQTTFKQVADKVTESTYQVIVHNGQEKDITVEVVAMVSGDWTITEESHAHTKDSANQIRWPVLVKAGKDTTLTYGVRTRF